MTKADIPFSNIFFGIGIIFILRIWYDQYLGKYYNGEELTYYTDSLKDKPSLIDGRRSADYYEFQLSYSKSKFIISNNGFSIIKQDKSKSSLVNSLDTGDVLKFGYPISIDDITRANRDRVKAISLSINSGTILSAEEVLKADKREKRKFYLIGIGLIMAGTISLYLRKRNKEE